MTTENKITKLFIGPEGGPMAEIPIQAIQGPFSLTIDEEPDSKLSEFLSTFGTLDVTFEIKSKYRVCSKCKIRHYENCESCWGFGVYSSTPWNAVHAIEAISGNLKGPVLPCPECRSTEKGVPTQETE